MLTSNPELYAELLVLSWVSGQSLGFLLPTLVQRLFSNGYACFLQLQMKPLPLKATQEIYAQILCKNPQFEGKRENSLV